MPWSRAFEDPIILPNGREMLTLLDAGNYIASLHWQAAIEALIMAAQDRGPLLHARVGITRALNRHVQREFNPSRKETRWGKRRSARDRPA